MPLTLRMITPDDLRDYALGVVDPEDRADIEAVIREDPRAAAIVVDWLTQGAVPRGNIDLRDGSTARASRRLDEGRASIVLRPTIA